MNPSSQPVISRKHDIILRLVQMVSADMGANRPLFVPSELKRPVASVNIR